jgi:hypothetical protein
MAEKKKGKKIEIARHRDRKRTKIRITWHRERNEKKRMKKILNEQQEDNHNMRCDLTE